MTTYADFNAFVSDFWSQAAYPQAQEHKYQCYSWTPTLFEESEWKPKSKPDAEPKQGLWRVGEACSGVVTLGYFDLDNHQDGHPTVTFDDVNQVLRGLGFSHLLYTSYSHLRKDGRHKVRIVIPLSRDVDYDTMFLLFVWFNDLFNYQLDGSIYDPGDHLYGPCFEGERRAWLEGAALDVDAILGLVESLPDEALEYAKRSEATDKSTRVLTPEELATLRLQMASMDVASGVGLDNPKYCKPSWLDEHDTLYKGGSHRQTLMGTLSRIWLYSGTSLTFGEMRSLQFDLDGRWGYYCQRTYGSGALADDLRSVMSLTGTASPLSDTQLRDYRLEQKMKFLASKRRA
ncbi:hypothetical protein [Microvirga pudoricolor]|uniref:hypothetical protein n=1 Tax=Microvirga pudoricolor TaxID=2778729 RepID=UPI0019519E3A|nr:hypothetical protein [Microvirga pudoricolor]MBM6595565.1 hypothetical protein [Microvirga pudoricolor]